MKKRVGKWKKALTMILAAAMLLSFVPAGNASAEEGSTATSRELLKMTLDYCEAMVAADDGTKYSADSFGDFQSVLAEAQSAYDENTMSDEEFYEMRDKLEEAKADLVFVADESAAINPRPFRVLSVDEIVAEMGTGWNLGNTMDGHTGFTPNETLWQNVETTKELLKSVHDLGFNTVRIPITWGTMINDEDYSIDEKWISRVQDIVDYAIAEDMYVIINIHHDGAEQTGWLRVAADDIDPVYEKFEGVWRTIANRFKDYDEHLIFESMNEVQGDNTTGVPHDTEVINNLNQIFVNVVRSTGSNNAHRYLSVPGRYTNIANTTNPQNGFELPDDTVEDRLFVAVHYYDWQFGMAENTTATAWSYNSAITLQGEFEKLVETFTSQGIPVILGEYGCINKNNSENRAYHLEVVNRLCQQDGVVPVYWDQGWYDRTMNPDFSYTLVDRNTGETIDKVVTDAIIRGYFISGAADLSDITVGTEVTQITDISVPESVIMTINETRTIAVGISQEQTNDVLLWSTDDPSIATVYNGVIRGRGIGTTTIHVYSQSGSVEKTIPVTVYALQNNYTNITITTDYDDGVTLEEGKYCYLNAVLSGVLNETLEEGADTEVSATAYMDFMTYKSSDESIATVSTTGKIVAKAAGTTYITITSASGVTSVIPVTVERSANVKEIHLALNVYFNDEEHSYFSNECGQSIVVTGDGQYELTFDCATDLSDKATSAGVTGLNNLTAVYIKDYSVTTGDAKISPLDSCNIMFDSVVVDGVALTVTQTDPKSALKASGIFDTNDPLNSWDGSQVAEVTVDNHVLNINGVDNPQKITITFTLSDMVFTEGATQETTVAAANVNSIDVADVTVTNDVATQSVALTVDGEDGAKLTVVPADASVVAIDTTALVVTGGKAELTMQPLQPGTTTVTVYADNGTTAEFAVTTEIIENTDDANGADAQTPADDSDTAPGDDAQTDTSASDDSTTKKKAGGTNWVLIIVVAVVAAVASGFIGYFVTNALSGDKKKDEVQEEPKEETKEETEILDEKEEASEEKETSDKE